MSIQGFSIREDQRKNIGKVFNKKAQTALVDGSIRAVFFRGKRGSGRGGALVFMDEKEEVVDWSVCSDVYRMIQKRFMCDTFLHKANGDIIVKSSGYIMARGLNGNP